MQPTCITLSLLHPLLKPVIPQCPQTSRCSSGHHVLRELNSRFAGKWQLLGEFHPRELLPLVHDSWWEASLNYSANGHQDFLQKPALRFRCGTEYAAYSCFGLHNQLAALLGVFQPQPPL